MDVITNMIDIHHHLLWGLDDGAKTGEQMERMLLDASSNGIHMVVATPHYLPGITPFPMERYQARLREANETCVRLGLDLTVAGGAEMLYTPQTAHHLANRLVPTMADSNKVLVEFPSTITVRELTHALETILRNGYVPIIAHVERYACLMAPLKDYAQRFKRQFEVEYQVNAETVIAGGQRRIRRTLHTMFKNGLIDYVATDAHNPGQRPCNLLKAHRQLTKRYGIALANCVTGAQHSLGEFLMG